MRPVSFKKRFQNPVSRPVGKVPHLKMVHVVDLNHIWVFAKERVRVRYPRQRVDVAAIPALSVILNHLGSGWEYGIMPHELIIESPRLEYDIMPHELNIIVQHSKTLIYDIIKYDNMT